MVSDSVTICKMKTAHPVRRPGRNRDINIHRTCYTNISHSPVLIEYIIMISSIESVLEAPSQYSMPINLRRSAPRSRTRGRADAFLAARRGT